MWAPCSTERGARSGASRPFTGDPKHQRRMTEFTDFVVSNNGHQPPPRTERRACTRRSREEPGVDSVH